MVIRLFLALVMMVQLEVGSHFVSITNLVSNIGVVATDTTGVGTGRASLAASGYGGDKAIFGFGTLMS